MTQKNTSHKGHVLDLVDFVVEFDYTQMFQ